MPIGKYFKGNGEEVMASMTKAYGAKKGKRVFYATANKKGLTADSAPPATPPAISGIRFNVSSGPSTVTSHLPKGTPLSPSGNLGARRAKENAAVGGFTDGSVLDASKAFTTRFHGSIT